jgi:hypothetical protein
MSCMWYRKNPRSRQSRELCEFRAVNRGDPRYIENNKSSNKRVNTSFVLHCTARYCLQQQIQTVVVTQRFVKESCFLYYFDRDNKFVLLRFFFLWSLFGADNCIKYNIFRVLQLRHGLRVMLSRHLQTVVKHVITGLLCYIKLNVFFSIDSDDITRACDII